MQEFGPSAASLVPTAQAVFGLVIAFLLGAVVGYLLRGWQHGTARRGDRDAAAVATRREHADLAYLAARRRTTWATNPAPPPESFPPRPAAPQVRGPATVLVADDRTELVALHATYLERHGYQVFRATDGQTALDLARAKHPSVIVLDHSMPRLSGLEVTRALKAEPATADIPVLLMTAHSYGAIGATAMAAGCSGFMHKPCDPSRVLREIAAYVRPVAVEAQPQPQPQP